MSDQMERETRNDPPFEVVEVNTATGETTIVVQRGIIGAMSNQLCSTGDHRKGSRILRKLGHILDTCGDVLYDKKTIEETDLDPELFTDQVDDS
ncbi:hypothetical protein LCGC14_0142690 [marine sediment metagenome]|uniref:Uncharacterized protein n=1 Tax=marine sediment metagenome TaxID=412755 RepID=A0A0F9V4V6_9ZZZZ